MKSDLRRTTNPQGNDGLSSGWIRSSPFTAVWNKKPEAVPPSTPPRVVKTHRPHHLRGGPDNFTYHKSPPPPQTVPSTGTTTASLALSGAGSRGDGFEDEVRVDFKLQLSQDGLFVYRR